MGVRREPALSWITELDAPILQPFRIVDQFEQLAAGGVYRFHGRRIVLAFLKLLESGLR